eukprot:225408-Rhodomonas_salina.2
MFDSPSTADWELPLAYTRQASMADAKIPLASANRIRIGDEPALSPPTLNGEGRREEQAEGKRETGNAITHPSRTDPYWRWVSVLEPTGLVELELFCEETPCSAKGGSADMPRSGDSIFALDRK